MSIKLYIPGPIEVSPKTLQAMAAPMIGHRSSDFVTLYNAIQPKLQQLAYTKDPVYLATSSAWGVMEASLRNLTAKKVLCCMNGAFSDKWLDVAQRVGKEAKGIQFEWGMPIDPEVLRKELATGDYDTLTLIHNETSTGTMSSLDDIMAVVRQFPEVFTIIDTVSSFSAVPIKKDELGIDVLLTGSQKALALPPGLALLSVSQRALDRAKKMPGRGYYFDFIEFQKNHEKSMTPSTPVLPLIYALKSKVDEIFEEGLGARYARHIATNDILRAWCARQGFPLLPEERFASRTLVCAKNERKVDLKALNKVLKAKYSCMINAGYGKLENITLRVSNMGDETVDTITTLTHQLDDALLEVTR
ncbi:MAG: aminotransferase class V-fold PLP-dependent enzyme [Verrucomicrobiota bacterium]|nr:aminotransferase class V-fold PLP-dependent enzyme [Verrucomicrobiota bacterium]